MNKACKNCKYMRYIPKEKLFYGMGFHWCDLFNDAISDVMYCKDRNLQINKIHETTTKN